MTTHRTRFRALILFTVCVLVMFAFVPALFVAFTPHKEMTRALKVLCTVWQLGFFIGLVCLLIPISDQWEKTK